MYTTLGSLQLPAAVQRQQQAGRTAQQTSGLNSWNPDVPSPAWLYLKVRSKLSLCSKAVVLHVCAAAVLLLPLVAVCVAVPASGQLPQIWPLDVTLTAERIGDKAAGAVTVINPTKGPIEVSGHTDVPRNSITAPSLGMPRMALHIVSTCPSCKQHDAARASATACVPKCRLQGCLL